MSIGDPDRRPPWDAELLASMTVGGRDTSKNLQTPTVGSGVSFTRSAKTADFDGTSNAVISYADVVAVDSVPLSVMAWVYIDTYTSYRNFVSKHTQSGTGDSYRGWNLYHGGGISRGLAFGRTENGTTKYRQYWSAVGTLTTATWYHVCATCSDLNSAPVLYINGASQSLSSSTIGTVTTIATSEPIRIGGKGAPDFTAYHDGMITGVRVYSRELTADEIAGIYAQGRP